MINAFKKSWQNALVLDGRTRRKDFWWALLGNFILLIILEAILSSLTNITGSLTIVIGILFNVLALLIYFVIFTLSVRRFHDIGKGKTIPIIFLILTILSLCNNIINLFNFNYQINQDNHILIGILGVISFAFVILAIVISIMSLVYCIQDSEKGTNQYGPNPKGETTQS